MHPAQRGVALLAAVLVVALAAVLIAGLLDRSTLGLARSLQQTRAAQAVAFQHGLELMAARVLMDDVSGDQVDSRADIWAQPMPPLTVPEGVVRGSLRDLDGCLNLNALSDADGLQAITRQRFERLFGHLRIDPGLVNALIDWIDVDGISESSGGAEDSLYATLSPPRRAANRGFVHVSELRAVAGVDEHIYEALLPHVCARPDPTSTTNLNTASAEVLMSLHEGIGPALAQSLHAGGSARFGGLEMFRAELSNRGIEGLVLSGLGTSSRYFVAEADILLADVPVRLYSLLERHNNRVTVVARSQGRF